MLERDAILAKIANIQNCLRMIRRVTGTDPAALDDQIKQDVFVLNLQRAAQAAIDIANLIITERKLGLPRSYRHGFAILRDDGVIDQDMADRMSRMAGFRNVAVHDYTKLDVAILKAILTKHLGDFEDFIAKIFAYVKGP